MKPIKLNLTIKYYIGDMQNRGYSYDSCITNQRVMEKFARYLEDGTERTLQDIKPPEVTGYVSNLKTREVRWEDHPNRKPVPGKLSPFTIRKEIKILKGFGTWLERDGHPNPFSVLVVPKEPRRLVEVLSNDEIEIILGSINPHTHAGARLYAMVLYMLDSGPRISDIINTRIPHMNMEKRQVRMIGKGDKERVIP